MVPFLCSVRIPYRHDIVSDKTLSSKNVSALRSRFIQAVEWVRTNTGLNYSGIAQGIAISPQAMSLIRSGQTKKPSQGAVLGLRTFGVNPTWVLTGAGQMTLDDVADGTAERGVAYDAEPRGAGVAGVAGSADELLRRALREAYDKIDRLERDAAASLRPDLSVMGWTADEWACALEVLALTPPGEALEELMPKSGVAIDSPLWQRARRIADRRRERPDPGAPLRRASAKT